MKFRINLKYFCTVFDGKELSLLVWLAILGVLNYCIYAVVLIITFCFTWRVTHVSLQ